MPGTGREPAERWRGLPTPRATAAALRPRSAARRLEWLARAAGPGGDARAGAKGAVAVLVVGAAVQLWTPATAATSAGSRGGRRGAAAGSRREPGACRAAAAAILFFGLPLSAAQDPREAGDAKGDSVGVGAPTQAAPPARPPAASVSRAPAAAAATGPRGAPSRAAEVRSALHAGSL